MTFFDAKRIEKANVTEQPIRTKYGQEIAGHQSGMKPPKENLKTEPVAGSS